MASQLALRVALFLLALLICAAVLVVGISYLAQAVYQSLLSATNPAIASTVTALLCLAPALCLIVFLARRSNTGSDNRRGASSNDDSVRDLVRANPWETLGAAFLLGISQSSSSGLDAKTLQQLVSLLQKEGDGETAKR